MQVPKNYSYMEKLFGIIKSGDIMWFCFMAYVFSAYCDMQNGSSGVSYIG